MAGREGRWRKPVARQQTSFRTIAVLTLIPTVALLVFLAWRFVSQQIASLRPPRIATASRVASPPPAPHRASRLTHHRGDLVLILDDVGFDHQPIERAMEIDPNVTFSILPNAGRAEEFAERLNRRGFEILCHLPMEPVDGRNSPGPNAITTGMSDDEIERMTRANVGAVPYARGVNNHMGSRATTDPRVMRSVLAALPEGMYFIDSKTTGGSVAARVAHQMNIRTASRSVFLDDVQNASAIRRQLAALANAAESNGTAVGIGHMYPVTVKVLHEDIPHLRHAGFRIVRASEVVQ